MRLGNLASPLGSLPETLSFSVRCPDRRAYGRRPRAGAPDAAGLDLVLIVNLLLSRYRVRRRVDASARPRS